MLGCAQASKQQERDSKWLEAAFRTGWTFTVFPCLSTQLALSWPEVGTKRAKAGLAGNEAASPLIGVEANLSRLVEMKEKGLITADEFAQMRKKELGIG